MTIKIVSVRPGWQPLADDPAPCTNRRRCPWGSAAALMRNTSATVTGDRQGPKTKYLPCLEKSGK